MAVLGAPARERQPICQFLLGDRWSAALLDRRFRIPPTPA